MYCHRVSSSNRKILGAPRVTDGDGRMSFLQCNIYVVRYDYIDPKLIRLSDEPCFYLSTHMNSSGVRDFLS